MKLGGNLSPERECFNPYISLLLLLFTSVLLSSASHIWERQDTDVKGTLDIVSTDAIKIVQAKYTHGPKLQNGKVTPKFMKDLIEFYNETALRGRKRANKLHAKFVFMILRQVRDYFKDELSLIEVELEPGEKITVCGDIHGNLADLLHIFDINGYPSPKKQYLFNGDFVNQNMHSVECALLLFGYKLLYPENFFINRGNHEDQGVTRQKADFLAAEVTSKYPGSEELLHGFWEVFQWLPLAHLISTNVTKTPSPSQNPNTGGAAGAPVYGRVLVVHGGLCYEKGVTLDDIMAIERGCDPVDENSIMFDLLWSDPIYKVGRHRTNARGISFLFGPDVTEDFCKLNRIDYIIRGHVPLKDGYLVEHEGRIITVFSTTGYGASKAAIAVLHAPELIPTFTTFAREYRLPGARRVYYFIDEKSIPLGKYRTRGPGFGYFGPKTFNNKN